MKNNNEINITEVTYVIEKINKAYKEKYDRDPSNYFTTGGCYLYALILKDTFNEGYIMHNNGHAFFGLNGQMYDVNYEIGLEYLAYHGGTDIFIADNGAALLYCELELFPDNKKEANELLDYLTPIAINAREEYEQEHGIGVHKK